MYAGKMGKTVSVKKYKNREKQTMKKTTEFTPTAYFRNFTCRCIWWCQCLSGAACRYDGIRIHSGSRDLDGDCAAVVKAGFDSGK